MSYHVECDWCGKWLEHEDDQAELTVMICHRKGKSRLAAQWSEEAAQTRHFCAPSKEDLDEGGRNRAGLVPDEQFDSCYHRAIAAITGTQVRDPGMGMEWRLVPVGQSAPAEPVVAEPAQEESAREKRFRESDEARAAWQRFGPAAREALLLQVLGDERLIIRELTARLNRELGRHHERAVYEGDLSHLVRRMLRAGLLERAPDPVKGKVRFRYFRKGLDGPIIEAVRGETVA